MANRRNSRTCDSGCTKQQEKEIEVLFEWQGNRSIINAKQSELLDRITEIFATFSGQNVQIDTLQSSRKVTGGKFAKQGKYLLLQRYVDNWKTYVNVDSIHQVKNRDTLTVTQLSTLSSTSTESRSQSPQSKTKLHACI